MKKKTKITEIDEDLGITEELIGKPEIHARKHSSPILKKLLKDMENDPWYVKFDRWFQLQLWIIDRVGYIEWFKIKIKCN